MKIGYVCTNFNNASFSCAAVKSLLETDPAGVVIAVVDNKSAPEDIAKLHELDAYDASVDLLFNDRNLGYFGGLNVGIRHLRRKYQDLNHIVIGNNDLIFPNGFITEVKRNAEKFKIHAVISPDVVTIDGVHQNPHVISGISAFRELMYDLYFCNYYIALVVRKIAAATRPVSSRNDDSQWRVAQKIWQGHGSCYIMGPLFFEHFKELWAPTFLMGEEYFLSKQLADRGLDIYYEPSIHVQHHYHATIDKVPARSMWNFARRAHKLYRNDIKPFRRSGDRRLHVGRNGSATGPMRAYKVCVNCVMDTTDSKIEFDEKGVCDHCRTFYSKTLPSWDTGERGQIELQAMVDQIKAAGRGKDFDCILGMSGGIDSSYLTYLAKEKLGLRPLVFHVDAGWNSQIAVNNIEKLVDKLGLDLFTEVIDWDEMRDLQLAFFKAGVPHIDLPQDMAFFGTMYKFAHKHKIKHILTGANLSTECIRNPVEWIYYGDSVQLRDIHRKFGTRPLVNFPVTNILWHKIYLPLIRGTRVLRPLNYMPYIKAEAMALLQEKFGWQPYPQKHFESRFTRFYEGYWLPKKFGYDTRRVQYSSLIVTKQMTRDEALERLKRPAYDEETIRQDFEYIATKLGISVEELQGYFEAPNKTYRDYRSQQYVFEMGARVMKALGMEVGGKR